MNQGTKRLTALMLAMLCAAGAFAASRTDIILDQVAHYTFGQSREPLRALADLARASTSSRKAQTDLAERLARMLQEEATLEGKEAICRALALIGGPGEVDALAALLGDPDLAQMARYALERIPGRAADAALIEAYGEVPAEYRIGILNSLGARRCARARSLLLYAARSGDPAEAEAAVAALGALESSRAQRALADLQTSADPALAAAVLEARLRAADHLLDRGKRRRAEAIYAALYEGDEPLLVRAAALRGLVACASDGHRAGPIIEALNETDPALLDMAVRLIREMPRERASELFTPRLSECPPTVQALVISILAERDLASERAAALLAALSTVDDDETKGSLLQLLGETGDPSALPDLFTLAETTANTTHRALALGACAQILAQPGDRSPKETAAAYAKALGLAGTPDETRAVLAGLSGFQMWRGYELARPYLKDDALWKDALEAGLTIARHASALDRERFLLAMAEMVQAARDEAARAAVGETLHMPERFEDYLVAWEVSEPYSRAGLRGGEVLEAVFPPEETEDGIRWRPMPVYLDSEHPWAMDFVRTFGGEDGDRAVYLRGGLISHAAQEVLVELGSNDGVKLWLNGALVHSNNAERGLHPGEDTFTLSLDEGENRLLMKVNNCGGQWGACMRLRRPDGGCLEGLRSAPVPE